MLGTPEFVAEPPAEKRRSRGAGVDHHGSQVARGRRRRASFPRVRMGRTIGSPELARPAGLRGRAGRRGVLLTPLGVTAGIGVMLNAGSVHFPKGFWNNKGGGLEYPLTIATVFAGGRVGGPWAVQPGPRDRLAADRLDVGRGRSGPRTAGRPGHGRRASSCRFRRGEPARPPRRRRRVTDRLTASWRLDAYACEPAREDRCRPGVRDGEGRVPVQGCVLRPLCAATHGSSRDRRPPSDERFGRSTAG